MSRLVKSILPPDGTEADGPHVADEDLARLAEGRVSGAERRRLIGHANRCPRCWEVLSAVVADLPAEAEGSWWSRNSRQLISVAASVMVVVLIGGGIYEYQSARQDVEAVPAAVALEEQAAPAPEPRGLAMKQAPAPAATRAPSVKMKRAPAPAGAPSPAVKHYVAPPPAPVVRTRPDAKVQDNMMAAPPVRAARPRPEPEARAERVGMAARPKKEAASRLAGAARKGEEGKAQAAVTLALDDALRGLLLAGEKKGWQDSPTRRALLAELGRRGLAVAGVRRIEWAGPRPSEDRPLVGVLKARVTGGVLSLKVVEAEDRP